MALKKTKFLFLHSIESSLCDKDKSYESRAVTLLSAWDQLYKYLKTINVEDGVQLMDYAFRFTFRFILVGDWYNLPNNVQSKLAPAIKKCMPLADKLNSGIVEKYESLIVELTNPWMQPVLQAILRGIRLSESLVKEFLIKEGYELLVIRLEVLIEEDCGDFALRLAQQTFNNLDLFGSRAKNEVNTLTDLYFSLLVRNNRRHDIINEVSKLDLSEGLGLLRRWHSKRHSYDSRISRSQSPSKSYVPSEEVCEILAHTILTSAMLLNVEEESKQHLLYDLIKEWVLMMVKNGTSLPDLTDNIRKMLHPAESSIHIYMFCLVLKEFDHRYRSLCVEMFIRGLTSNINEVESYKINADTENVLKSEARLSDGFLQLADFLKDKLLICRECVLTAFSLHPSEYTLNLVFELAFLSKKSPEKFEYCVSKSKIVSDCCYLYSGKVKSRECLSLKPLFNKSSKGKLLDVMDVSPIDIFDSDSLELPPQLCDDLTTLIHSSRNLTLKWQSEWSTLKSKCISYLNEYNQRHKIEHDTDATNNNSCSKDLVTESLNNNNNDLEETLHLSEATTESVEVKKIEKLTFNPLTLAGQNLQRYLSTLNLNPKVVLTRTPEIESLVSNVKDSSDLKDTSGKKNVPNDPDRLWSNSVPGLNSLDMIVPETQQPTIQVVQVSNNSSVGQSSVTTECQTTPSEHSFKNTPLYSQPCNTPFLSSDTLEESHSDVYVAPVSNSSPSASKEKINISGWTQISRSSSLDHIVSTEREPEYQTSEKNNLYSSGSSTSNSCPKNVDNESNNETCVVVNTHISSKNSSTSSSKLNSEVGEDTSEKIKKNNKFEFESREVNIGNIKKGHSYIVKPMSSTGMSKDDQDNCSPSGSILRVIVRDYKGSEQFITGDGNKTELLKITNSGLINDFNNSFSEQIFKLIRKKDNKPEIIPSASLPNFQHVFGRQGYQNQSDTNESNVSLTNCHISSAQEINKDSRPANASISKGIQTVSKDQVESDDCSSSNVYSISNTSPSSVINSAEPSQKTIGTDAQPSSSSLILAYKIPVTNNNVVQLKNASVLKKTGQEMSTKTLKSDGSQTVNTKESVIRNSMNFLLSAALKSPVKTFINTTDNKEVADKKVGDNCPNQQKAKIAMNVKKTIKKNKVGTVQRIVKPVTQSNVVNNICQTEPTVVSFQVPLKSVQVISSDINNCEGSIKQVNASTSSDDGSGSNSISNNQVESSAVSSTTLEQLREFESVLEHVTNTSQMKEKTIQDRLDDHASIDSSEELTMDSKPSNFVNTLTVVKTSTATSTCTTVNKTSNTSPTNVLNSPKITASTSVVLVSGPVVSPPLSLSSQSPVSPIPLNGNGGGCKLNQKINKSKSKTVSSKTTSPTSTLKVSNLPKPQQKPQEDEQTTQRIYAILDRYAEQLRNSPELKNKPAPRRRSNPPSNPSHSTKRKKSSHSKPKSSLNMPSSSLDLSPASEDIQTLGSEDSSNGVSQLSQTLNSPQNTDEHTATSMSDFPSEMPDSIEKEAPPKHKIVITDASPSTSGRTVIVQDNIQQSVINMDNTKLISGKQVLVGGTNSVPLALLSSPTPGSVKQVIFPVSSDCRPLVVATKVPKMYRVVTTGGVPTGSPILTSGATGTVLLRQMCLNKATPGINLKSLKVPVMSSGNVGSITPQTVVLPSGTQTIPLTSANFSETFGVSLDNTIMFNSHSGGSVSLISNKKINKVIPDSNIKSTSTCNDNPPSSATEAKVESVIVSCNDPVIGKLPVEVPKIPISATTVLFRDNTSQKMATIEAPKRLNNKMWNQSTSPQKETEYKDDSFDDKKSESGDLLDCDKNKSSEKKLSDDCMSPRKETFSVICTNESVIKSGFYSDQSSSNLRLSMSDTNSESVCSKMKTDFLGKSVHLDSCQKDYSDNSSIFSQAQDKKKCVVSDIQLQTPIFNLDLKQSDKFKTSYKLSDSLQRLAADKELNLQKSLSEECEDLGVDKPSTSDLFPEAEILEPDPLSRESTPIEAFSRSLDSSSSSHDSPSRSPIFSSKTVSSPWYKQNSKNSVAKRYNRSCNNQTNLPYYLPSKTKNNGPSCTQSSSSVLGNNVMSSDVSFNPNLEASSSSLSSKMCDIVDSKSDSWSDDPDLCNFTELDESLDSFTEDDFDSATSKIKSFPHIGPNVITIPNSTMSSDSSEVSLQDCFNMTDTAKCSSDCKKNGVEAGESDSDANIETSSSGMTCSRKRKLNKFCDNQKVKETVVISDDSMDSSDASRLCDTSHSSSARRSSSRSLIKKGCSCCVTPHSTSKRKHTQEANKSEKISFQTHSQYPFGSSGKKITVVKHLKASSKKR